MLQRARASIRGKLALLAAVPVTCALLLALLLAHDARQRAASAASLGSIEDLARLASYIADVVHAVQDERAARSTSAGLGAAGMAPAGACADTDAAAARLETFLSTRDRSKLPARLSGDLVRSSALLRDLISDRTAPNAKARLQDLSLRYASTTRPLIDAIAALPELTDDGEMLRNLTALVALLELEERSSVEQAIVGYAAARGEFPPGAYKALVTTSTEEQVFREAFETSASTGVRDELERARARGKAADEMLEGCLSSTEDAVTVEVVAWNETKGSAIRGLRGVERILLGRIETAAAGKSAELRRTIRLTLGLSLAVLVVSLALAFLVRLVAARSAQLASRNAALRLVLDNVDQGLATVGPGGVLNTERSAAFDRWFASSGGATFYDAIAPEDSRLRASLDIGYQQVEDGILPVEVSLDQLPKRFDRDGRHFTFGLKPLFEGETVAGALVVVTDVTAELEARREHAKQREETSIFRRLAHDKSAFVAFLEETGSLVDRLRAGTTGAAEQMALVHTIKGNAAQYDARSVADVAHELESEIVDSGRALDVDRRLPLLDAWDSLTRQTASLVGGSEATIQLAPGELERLIRAVAGGIPTSETLARLRMLFDEPVALRFARLGDHAQRLAGRLGKAVPDVTVNADDLRLPRQIFSPIWGGLVQVIRNAVDHGIESAEARAAAGKPPQGKVELRARRQGPDFVIEVADDGAGIDWTRVAAKARAAGLPASRPADLERALFTSGISTRDAVTDVSGRGVGLAAVWNAADALGGTVRVESAKGRGTRFVFRLPVVQQNRGAA
ncbi:MAG: nitrate- and nitrite sensing domain-containing protein [Polyangiaceae bacterium]